MKRIILSVLLIFSLTACSLQQNMNSELFFKRFIKYDNSISVNNSFYDNNSFVCYALYHNADVIFTISEDKDQNIKKINLTCSNTDKINEFADCSESIIKIYAPDDNSKIITENLFKTENINNEFIYYDTQWYTYSTFLSDDGLYFSVSGKKLSPESKVELSLKQNDIIEY
ncbi:MAG: hypothetical protein U0L11_08005 [Acutalibacteraceae bacterium]|nr:hypothetical protein [Acutalibacteraceae bacterium]